MEHGVLPEKILLLTFTNKAANEMKYRASKMSDPRCGDIHASTYHSFCSMLLRRYAKYANLPENFTNITPSDTNDAISLLKAERNYHKVKGFPKASVISAIISASINKQKSLSEIMDDARYSKYEIYLEEISLLYDAYKAYKQERGLIDYDDMLVKEHGATKRRQNMSVDYKNELNEEQYEAVTTTEGPLLILAAAGTGKTRTLIYRVSYLVEQGVMPEKILLLTFTNKAANEMISRASQMADERCANIHASTYHSFCSLLLRRYAKYANLPDNFTNITPSDTNDAISLLKAERNYHKIKGFPKASIIAAIISASINRQKSLSEIMENERYQKYEMYLEEIALLYDAYKSYKEERGMIDYDDMLVKTYLMLRDNEAVRKKVEKTYDYIMVDEYQDTNKLQDMIVSLIRQENRNIAVVGDDMQSLYAFRGAEVENILTFERRNPGCKVVKLVRNYRSNQEILDLANDVVKMNSSSAYLKEMKTDRYAYRKPVLLEVNNSYREDDAIINIINAQRNKGIPLNEICILTRKASATYLLEANLNQLGIPYNKYGGLKFFDRSHVQDVIAMLRCALNPYDELAYYRSLQLFDGIGKIYAQKISSEVPAIKEDALISPKYKSRMFAESLKNFREEIIKWRTLDLVPMLDSIIVYYHDIRRAAISKMKLTNENERAEKQADNDKKKDELQVLKEMATGYVSPLEFLDQITVDANSEKDEDALVISTIHSVKGLEFDTVLIRDCADTVFPSTDVFSEGSKEDEEELRCFYVAITRAKNTLYMMYPATIMKYGHAEDVDLSHFLQPVHSYEKEYF